jgi:hypothetical protein
VKPIKIPFYCLAVFILLLLMSCNLRENILLPPGISYEEYIESNSITSLSNYLVKSSNDNSYIFISKQAIADSIIRIGDQIVFYQDDSMVQRDTLHIAFDKELSPALSISIIRNNVALSQNFPADYQNLTIYTDYFNTAALLDTTYCITLSDWLDCSPISYDIYARNRIS